MHVDTNTVQDVLTVVPVLGTRLLTVTPSCKQYLELPF